MSTIDARRRWAADGAARGTAVLRAHGVEPREPASAPVPNAQPGAGQPGEPDPWSARLDGASPDGRLRRAIELLAGPTERLLAIGGDERGLPSAGRSSYGLRFVDLEPSVRGSSCTATPPDATALRDADAWRTRLLGRIVDEGALPSPDELRAPIVEDLLAHLGLAREGGDRLVLTPSGTDVEALVSALVLGGGERRVCNILVGSREAGSGTRLAAAGRYFRSHTPFRAPVETGTPLPGFPVDDVRIVDVEIRDQTGRARPSLEVEAEVAAAIEDAVARGERVLVHAMAGSKTDLRLLSPAWVRSWRGRLPLDLRVLVDAAQGRIDAATIGAYRRAGAAVSVTGSKALGAPAFCGALLLDSGLAVDAEHVAETGMRLPAGIADFLAEADLPRTLRPIIPTDQQANLGLLARWHVGLREAARREAIPSHDRALFTHLLVAGMADGLASLGGVRVEPVAPETTIVSFVALDASGAVFGKKAARELYAASTMQPGVQLGQPVELVPDGAAALRYAIGSPTITRALGVGVAPDSAAATTAGRALEAICGLLQGRAS